MTFSLYICLQPIAIVGGIVFHIGRSPWAVPYLLFPVFYAVLCHAMLRYAFRPMLAGTKGCHRG